MLGLSSLCLGGTPQSSNTIKSINFTIVNNSSINISYQYVNTNNYSNSFSIASGGSANIPSNAPSGEAITPVLFQGSLSQTNTLLTLPLQLSLTYPYPCKVMLTLNVTIDNGAIHASPAIQINASKLHIGAITYLL